MKKLWGTIENKHKISVAGGLCVLAAAPWMAQAQNANDPSGTKVTLDISQTLESSDNFNLSDPETSGSRGVTRLGFGVSSQTQTQTLLLSGSGSLRYGDLDADESNFGDSNIRLDYTREGANSLLTTSASYTQGDARSSFLQNLGLFEFLVTDEGLRQDLRASVGLELGVDGPIGATFQFSQDTTTYTDTSDPNLFDVDTTTASTELRFELNSQVTARIQADVSERTTEGIGVDRDSSRLALALEYVVSPTFTTNASINYTTIDLLDRSGFFPVNTTEDGLGFSFGFSHDRPNGVISASISSDAGENGRRTTFNTSRSFELQNAQMTLNFGLSRTEGFSGTDPLFGIQYAQQFRRGVWNLSLDQSVGARVDNEEIRSTTLSTTYSQELSALSSVDASLSLQDLEILGNSAEPDSSRVDLSLSYRHALSQDWDLVSTYIHSKATNDLRSDISSNTVSLSVERSFSWFP